MLKISYLELSNMIAFGILIALVTTGLWLNAFSIIGLAAGGFSLIYILINNRI